MKNKKIRNTNQTFSLCGWAKYKDPAFGKEYHTLGWYIMIFLVASFSN